MFSQICFYIILSTPDESTELGATTRSLYHRAANKTVVGEASSNCRGPHNKLKLPSERALQWNTYKHDRRLGYTSGASQLDVILPGMRLEPEPESSAHLLVLT